MIYEVTIGGKARKVELTQDGTAWRCKLDGREFPLDVSTAQNGVLSILVDGRSYEVKQDNSGTESNIVVGNERFEAVVRDPRSFRSRRRSGAGDEGLKKVIAPMPGKVVRILAPAGTRVEGGQAVLVIEAMKMQNEMKSPKKGTVKRIHANVGAPVEAGQVLAEIE
ncbi:MAG TPA: biotin/lipoyl-containing protein [Candidatus Angelobacter sp.]|nr:biotin/lipoyl-containing protein [Candidatus Angelobacter sp.]